MLFSLHTTIAQDNIKLLLNFKMVHVADTTQRSIPRVSPCMLIAGSATSVYDDYYKSMYFLGYSGVAVDRVFTDPNDIDDYVNGITTDQVYTDFEKQELTTGAYIAKILYAKTEPHTKIDWKIEPQRKKILDHECQMATADFKGRHYTAWFAPDIPISAGPWKLNGLPGIILAANDDKNEISFTCTKISEPPKTAPPITFRKDAVIMSAEKFDKTKKAFDRDPVAMATAMRPPSADPRGTRVAGTASPGLMAAMEGSAPKTKLRLLNNPIEKE